MPGLLDLLDRLGDEPATLALGERLRREHPADLVAAALTQQELRRAAQTKFTRAARMLFTRAGLEQASGEVVATHRATRFEGRGRLADLCCGIGGDLIALAAGHDVLAVDRDPVHVDLAAHNASVYGHTVRTSVADVRDVDLADADGIFADPARRAGVRRLRAGESEPPLAWCVDLATRVPAVAIKAAPGVAHTVVPPGWEIEFVAEGREMKEATLWSPALATAARRATILPGGDTLLPEPGPDVAITAPGGYLLDPNPAVTRAGLVADLARRLGAWQIDPQIAFLSLDADRRTPFARTLRVVESAAWNEKRFARLLREHRIGAVDLRRRGLAGDVDLIRRRLKPSGPNCATLVLTRVNDAPWGLICVEP